MHFVYIDDSRDDESQPIKLCAFAAILIPESSWLEAFKQIKEYRRNIHNNYGIFVAKELHASEFVGGRGHISNRVVTKAERAKIFGDTLAMVARLPNVKLIAACGDKNMEMRLFERLNNRINICAKKLDDHALLLCDDGKNVEYTHLARKMGVYNPIPSQYGVWKETQQNWKNICTDAIIEDPIFKDSKQSYFIQLADFISFALLRKEHQIPSRNKYNIQLAFDNVANILIRDAFKKDPLGIIRAT